MDGWFVNRWRVVVGTFAGAALATALTACGDGRQASEPVVEHGRDPSFYVLPDPLPPGEPGALIRRQRLRGAPDGAIAWRVLYHSRDIHGEDIAVSGVVVAPTRPAPDGGNTIVSWGHPTTGSASKCAPSSGVDPFITIEGLRDLISDGYVVTATDYPGMGAPGPPSYLIGASEGNAVLDAARAAREISDTHSSDKLLLWGHSQGGHAALFAAQDAPTYAPDLKLLGVAVAAPATDLGALLQDDIADDSGVTLGAYAFDAYQRVYGSTPPMTPLTSILTPAGALATPQMAKLCLFGSNAALHKIATPLVGNYLARDPEQVEPWKTWLADNTPGSTEINAPILVVQGADDRLVEPAITKAYVQRLCKDDEPVLYQPIAGATHPTVAIKALPRVRGFFSDAAAGGVPPSTCQPDESELDGG